MRLNIHEMKQAAQLVLDWHSYEMLMDTNTMHICLCCQTVCKMAFLKKPREKQLWKQMSISNSVFTLNAWFCFVHVHAFRHSEHKAMMCLTSN